MYVLEKLLDNWVPVLVVGAGVLLPICAVIAHTLENLVKNWRQSHRDQQQLGVDEEMLRLKQSMIARGMSADEIERVLKAGSHTPTA